MARMSRLLGAACLGVAVTAGFAAATVSGEFSPVRRAPAALHESAQTARIIVKFRDRASTLSAASHSGRAGIESASLLGSRLGLALTDGRTLGPRTQVVM